MSVLQVLLSSLPLIGCYSLATFGIVLIFRTSATTNYAQGLIGSAGAFIAAYFSIHVFGRTNYILATVIAMAIAFLFGVFVDSGIIKRGDNLNPAQKQIVTMGLLLIINAVTPIIFKSSIISQNNAVPYIFNTESWMGSFLYVGKGTSWGGYITAQQLTTFLVALVVLGAVFAALKFTKWGLSVRATASNETVGQMMGINTRFVSAISWGISAALVTLSACLLAGTPISTAMMGNIQVFGFLSVVLGGLTSFFAPIIGTIIIPILYITFTGWTSVWGDAFVFVAVLLLIILFPNGLFGKKTVKKV